MTPVWSHGGLKEGRVCSRQTSFSFRLSRRIREHLLFGNRDRMHPSASNSKGGNCVSSLAGAEISFKTHRTRRRGWFLYVYVRGRQGHWTALPCNLAFASSPRLPLRASNSSQQTQSLKLFLFSARRGAGGRRAGARRGGVSAPRRRARHGLGNVFLGPSCLSYNRRCCCACSCWLRCPPCL